MKLCKVQICFVTVLLAVCILALTSCGKTSGSDVKAPEKKEEKEFKHRVTSLENSNITFAHNAELENSPDLIASFEAFEKKYGGKVNYIQLVGTERQARLITMVSSDDAPDVASWLIGDMPKWAMMNLFQPIEDYVDVSDPVWKLNVMELQKYKDRFYGVTKDVVAWVIFYNKTLFDNNGIKTPMQHYKEGNWNWNTFRQSAMALTQDTNKDGVVDQWGFFAPNSDIFVYSNGGDYIRHRPDGGVDLLINQPQVIEALQFYQDAIIKDKYYNKMPNWSDAFFSGKIAMAVERHTTQTQKLREFKYEWDIAPFPNGPSGKPSLSLGGSGSWGIPTGAKNPQGAAAWMYLYTVIYPDVKYKDTALNEEQIKLGEKLCENIVLPRYGGVAKMSSVLNKNIYNELPKGTPVQTAVDTAIPLLQSEIDTLLSTK